MIGTGAVVRVDLVLGEHSFSVNVSDGRGANSTAIVRIAVRDTAAPVASLVITPSELWPPNHKLVSVAPVVTASDECDANPSIELLSVTSSEPDNGLGDGDTVNDIQGVVAGTNPKAISLRAERSGAGSGRIYTFQYRVHDGSGNSTTASGQVLVPHDRR